jgi:hypothetical protein
MHHGASAAPPSLQQTAVPTSSHEYPRKSHGEQFVARRIHRDICVAALFRIQRQSPGPATLLRMSSSEESSEDDSDVETTSSSGSEDDSDSEQQTNDETKPRPPMMPVYLQQTDTFIRAHSTKLTSMLSGLMPSAASGTTSHDRPANQSSGNVQIDLLRRQIRDRSMQLGALQEQLKQEEERGKSQRAGAQGETGAPRAAAEMTIDDRLAALEKLFVNASMAAQAYNDIDVSENHPRNGAGIAVGDDNDAKSGQGANL